VHAGVEACDLGDGVNGPTAACSIACTPSSCGDSKLDPGEECDDGGATGNNDNTDSCLDNCTWNKCGDGAWYRTENNIGNPNNVEECDDANTDQTDECLSTCVYNDCGDASLFSTVKGAYSDPDGAGPMTPAPGPAMAAYLASRTPVVVASGDNRPDNIKNKVVEACDDGNTVNTDACLAKNLSGNAELECVVAACGDGETQAGTEECDDANTNQNDSCLNTCKTAKCHDGWVQTTVSITGVGAVEACDDGNTDNTDYCVGECIVGTCGDTYVNAATEMCDTANASPTCAPGCILPTCGNGVINGDEQCDDGANNGSSNSCLSNCKWNTCGDGHEYTTETNPDNTSPFEGCDDGNDNPNDQCTNACADAECGDGVEHQYNVAGGIATPAGTEDCDDGNQVNDDACPNDCDAPTCGDGIVQTGEECDDGNGTATDTCLSNVAAAVGSLARSCKINVCGDGVKGTFEGCDDGNTTDNDACSNSCRPGTCGSLAGTSVTYEDLLFVGVDNDNDGDGVCETGKTPVDDGLGGLTDGNEVCTTVNEECDDQNSSDTDGCTNRCVLAYCGDGILQTANGEQCDDANLDNEDDCTSACMFNVCGDGVRHTKGGTEAGAGPLEACDVGASYDAVGAAWGGTPASNPGGLYPSHADRTLTAEQRDDGYNDEVAFCNPGTCALQCNSGADFVNSFKGGTTCVFVATENDTSAGPTGSDLDDGDDTSFTDLDTTWEEAREACKAYGIGADMVALNLAAGVPTQLTALDDFDTDDSNVWVGLNDIGTNADEATGGKWVWLDSTTVVDPVTVPWETNEPSDDGDEDCAVENDMEFNAHSCEHNHNVYCEFDPTP
jgi:cysteine-rich repeat protein